MFFGSAFAIAQYGRGLFLSSGDTMMVVLVSAEPATGSDGDVAGRQVHHASAADDQVVRAKPIEHTINDVPAVQNEMPVDVRAAPETIAKGLSGQVSKKAAAGKNDRGSAPSVIGAGEGMAAQSGGIPPEDWASLAAAIERTKNYPRLARERGIEGVVRVRFRLTSFGTVEKIEIVQSSGSPILDEASISTVYRAAPMHYVSGWVEMPMKYVLK